MSESSSYWYDSSPVIGTTSQIVYGGADVYCGTKLVACKGTRLSTMQVDILTRICELEGVTDMTSINIPCSLEVAWTTQDHTILNYIQYLLNNACAQKSIIDGLPTTNNPNVTITYCCCTDGDGCNTQVTLTLSEHIQKIIDCLCNYKEEVASTYATQQEVTTLHKLVSTLIGKVDVLEKKSNFNG